ncbi:NnrS family protein [Blastochloris viridis]|nr:NnrS family protein [Blastochloris viridis]BAR99683.1 NnrS protein [Blastochloris viridis]
MTNQSRAETRRAQRAALFTYGFRPFFLFGALWAALAILLWLPQAFGEWSFATVFTPVDWHVHEMLYGYLGAVIAGFLLTAVPNWTGRLPLAGAPLVALVLVWAAGRAAVFASGWLGAAGTAVVDVAFAVLLAAAIAREIVAGRNWRNLKVLLPLVLFIAGNVAFHVEVAASGRAAFGIRIGFAAVVLLVVLIGGRIVPSFTRNWLARRPPGRMPAPFDRFDAVVVTVTALALLGWIMWPEARAVGVALAIAGLAQAARLLRWAGERTAAEPLVLILHLAYAFVPLGFLLIAATALGLGVPASAGLHAFGVGAFGTMTLAVMSRSSLGHTGRALHAGPATVAIYAFVLVAAAARIAAALAPASSAVLLHIAAFAWIAAFAGFALAYGPQLVRPRR